MTSPNANHSTDPKGRLLRSLYPVAKRIRGMRCRELRSRALWRAFVVCVAIAAAALLIPAFADYALIAAFVVASAFLIHASKRESQIPLDYLAAARSIEAENRELKQVLVTATEHQLAGAVGFFPTQVVNQALAAPSLPAWNQVARKQSYQGILVYIASLAGVSFCLLVAYLASDWSFSSESAPRPIAETRLHVEPGNLELERGASLLVTARFEGELPQDVSLEVLSDTGTTELIPMGQSLSDPVFAYSLRSVEQPLRYRIVYGDQESETYRISTYELPQLLHGDADLDFPDYTGWPDRSIADTLRISAIEGTRLAYRFNANKPLQSAYLIDKQGQRIDLPASDETALQFRLDTTLSKSASYTLHLQDEAGRKNVYPPEIRIEAILNKRPTLRLETPKGDQRLSALEEVLFTGKATDDFGLQDYGIGFAFAADDRDEISLAESTFERGSLSETLTYLLPLEEKSLQAKDTLSWYLWATDFGPDGELRRTTGDLYFANIRSFDEIFREQDQGGGQGQGQGQASGQGLELLEKQRRIAISLFRIKNSATDAESAIENIDVVQQSQVEALNELHQLIPQLREASAIEHATGAQRFMEGVDVGLINAIDTPSLDPLELAWSDAQSAYDKLVKLSEDEFNVSRSQSQSQGSGGSASRNQSQINELDFRQEDSRYETASEAQSLASPEDRQNLELVSKLNELSRRQDDLNERLQEMQSELANAKTEDERERIQRELKRLEEEQREMLTDADAAIQQAGNRQSTQQARQQLEEARENMRRASEQMEEGQISQALASGTRAQDTLDKTREQMREANSSQFSEAMREARSQAKQLVEEQKRLERELAEFSNDAQQRLDDSEEREALAQNIEEQSAALDTFLNEVRKVAEDSENVEPGLFRDLYQILRDSNSSRFEERYENSAQYLRQGFLDEASEGQGGLSNDLERLNEAISQAAEGILGSEGATLRFAQSEIDSLREQLENERPTDQPGEAGEQSADAGQRTGEKGERAGNGGSSGGGVGERFRNAIESFGGSPRGPLTGEDFGEWIERLSTVESLVEDPLVRTRIAEARETAEEMRRDFKRHSEAPKWELIVNDVAAPLNEVSAWLSSELNRIENPDALQAIDSDPVPDEYEQIVQRYYESLGND